MTVIFGDGRSGETKRVPGFDGLLDRDPDGNRVEVRQGVYGYRQSLVAS